MTVELVEITDDLLDAAFDLRVKPGQERYVSSVRQSLADAASYPETAWPRLVVDDDRAVGFVMGGFSRDERVGIGWVGPTGCAVWKLLIDGAHQGRGYGRFAVEAVADEARRRGFTELRVFFHPGPDGPQGFWEHLGFVVSDPNARPEVPARRPL